MLYLEHFQKIISREVVDREHEEPCALTERDRDYRILARECARNTDPSTGNRAKICNLL